MGIVVVGCESCRSPVSCLILVCHFACRASRTGIHWLDSITQRVESHRRISLPFFKPTEERGQHRHTCQRFCWERNTFFFFWVPRCLGDLE